MPNVPFKFIITETPLPADQDGRQQIIASISDDNAKRITDLTGLAGEVEALKAHCHRMLNLARNRFLGYCDHNRSTQAILEECQRMGLASGPAEHASDRKLFDKWYAEQTAEIADLRAKLAEAERVRADQVIAFDSYAEQRDAARQDAEALRPKARMHDDAQAMLDTLGIARRSENGAEFTLQHRIGVLNDEAEREKGAAYRDAAAAEALDNATKGALAQWKERAEKAEAEAAEAEARHEKRRADSREYVGKQLAEAESKLNDARAEAEALRFSIKAALKAIGHVEDDDALRCVSILEQAVHAAGLEAKG